MSPRRPAAIYTRGGDDGTTALLGGGRVPKGDARIELNGTLDEAQAFLGMARAECRSGEPLEVLLVALERELWTAMGELALAPAAPAALRASVPSIRPAMVQALEARIDEVAAGLDLERAFAVPGDNRRSAALDVARAVVRRAERQASALEGCPATALAYLNRLSDLCWVLARQAERAHLVQRRPAARPGRGDEPVPGGGPTEEEAP